MSCRILTCPCRIGLGLIEHWKGLLQALEKELTVTLKDLQSLLDVLSKRRRHRNTCADNGGDEAVVGATGVGGGLDFSKFLDSMVHNASVDVSVEDNAAADEDSEKGVEEGGKDERQQRSTAYYE